MLYLATSPSEPAVVALLDAGRIGLMCQPGSNHPRAGWAWSADNGCHTAACFADGCAAAGCSAAFDETAWAAWLARLRHLADRCLFATVPDVVADAAATLDRWGRHVRVVELLGYRPAFVAQDGQEALPVPWAEIGVLFVGGSTRWKLSEHPRRLAAEARERGLPVHVGRVNSGKRYRAWAPHADSADGSFLARSPSGNVPRMLRWLERHEAEPTLWERG